MSVTVGTNAYITAAEYTDYAAERGITVNTATLDADIIKSADFINTHYNLLDAYKLPTTDTAAITAIKKAALKAVELQQAGRLTINAAVLTGGVVSSETKELDGVGSKSVTYEAGTTPTARPRTPELDNLIRQSGAVLFSSGIVRG